MQQAKDFLSSTSNCITLASVTAVGAAASYYLWRHYKLQIPGNLVPVGRLEKIIIYPIKSLPGVQVPSAYATKLGLQYGPFQDRSFVLYKEESGMFITMRQEPKLALLNLSLQGVHMCIDFPGMNTLKVPIKKAIQQGDLVKTLRLFGQDMDGVDCGDDIAQWFQSYLGKPGFRLMQYVPSIKPRKLITNLINQFSPGQMLYHDDCAYLILSEASISDLNSRLVEKVTYKNFRPNFVISNCAPYAEDNMKYAQLGESKLLFMSHCGRCVLTTVNPETGVKMEKEPLATLKTYRKVTDPELIKVHKEAPLFGIYMGTRKEGTVSTGDTLYGVPF